MFGKAIESRDIDSNETLYVMQPNSYSLLAYALPDSKNAGPKCSAEVNAAYGIGVDPGGLLFVPQIPPGTLTTYEKGGCTQGRTTLNQDSEHPADVAFARDGTVYVAWLVADLGSPGFVSVYPRGGSNSTSRLHDPSFNDIYGIAVSRANDVFVSALVGGKRAGCSLFEFRDGKMPAKRLNIEGDACPYGLTFDHNQNLLAVDSLANAVLVYPPPYEGKPKSVFALKGGSRFGKLDAKNANFYVADQANGSVDVYAYPSGTFRYSITAGLEKGNDGAGIAIYPASLN